LLIFDFGKNLLDKNCFSYSEKEFRTEMQLNTPCPAPLWMKTAPRIDVFHEISSLEKVFQSKKYA